MADIAPLQPRTLAAFLPWGSSEGAGRVSRCKNKPTYHLDNLFLLILFDKKPKQHFNKN